MTTWFSITNKSESEADVQIYDQIGGFGISADSFVKQLKALNAKTINLHLNTPGGSVFDGTAIYNALKAHPAKVVVYVDGVAASIGSIIAMAGEEIRIAKNAYMMIHDPAGLVFGSAADMRKMADVLDKMKGSLATTYADRAGKSKKYWMDAMAGETWYDAQEAKDAGLADTIIDAAPEDKAAVNFDASIFNNIPPALKERMAAFQNTHGPKVAASAAPVTAPLQEIPMTLEAFNEYAAANPSAVAQFIEKGKKAGVADAHAAEIDRMKSIAAAVPGKPQIAVDAFIAGQDAATAKLTFDAVVKADAAHEAALEAQRTENKRLQALLDAGGHPGGVGVKPEGEKPTNIAGDPEATAKAEWQKMTAEQKGEYIDEDAYIRIRKKELAGK